MVGRILSNHIEFGWCYDKRKEQYRKYLIIQEVIRHVKQTSVINEVTHVISFPDSLFPAPHLEQDGRQHDVFYFG